MLTEAALYEQQELEDGRFVAVIEAQQETTIAMVQGLVKVLSSRR